MVLDLKTSLDCIAAMKDNKRYRGEKIGIVRKKINGMVSGFEIGEIVLYRKGSDGCLTVETAMTREQIEDEKKRNSLIATIRTTVGVPESYIDEILI